LTVKIFPLQTSITKPHSWRLSQTPWSKP